MKTLKDTQNRELVFINVYNSHEDDGFLPTSLHELQALIDNCLTKIPLNNTGTYVDIVPSDDPRIGITIQIGYSREETSEEANNRHNARKDALRKEIEAKSKLLRELCLRYPAL